jgi:hypothetical protein
MKIRAIWGLLLSAAIPFLFLACDKDDEPKPAGIGFENSVEEITESDGTITSFHPLIWESYSGETGATGKEYEVKLVLDKPVSATAVISYSVAGTATKNSASSIGDFDVEGTTVTIEEGQSEAVIPLTIFEDMDFELSDDDSLFETVEITLNSVVSGPVVLGEQTVYKLKINEDDAVWILQWGTDGTDSPGDVDMDILFTYDGQIVWGAASDEEFEAVNVPAGFPNGTYGLSYTYYEGTSDDVDFVVGLFNTSGSLNGVKYTYPDDDPLLYSGHYTLSNINAWSESSPPLVVQNVTKSGINYTDITDITEPASGSRGSVSPAFKLNREFVSKIGTLNNVRSTKK